MQKAHSEKSQRTPSETQPQLYFDPTKGWYEKGTGGQALPFQPGEKPYYDKALGEWVKPELPRQSHPGIADATTTQASNSRVVMPDAIRSNLIKSDVIKPDAIQTDAAKVSDKIHPEEMFSQAVQLFTKLPENLLLKSHGREVSLETDLPRLMDAIPGVQLNDQARQIMDHVKRVHLDGEHVTLDLKSNFTLPLQNEKFGQMVNGLTFGNVRHQVSFDAAFLGTGEDMRLTNVRGINVEARGNRRLQIHELSMNAAGENPALGLVLDNPKKFSILRAFSSDNISMQMPLRALDAQLSPDTVRTAMRTAHTVRDCLEQREAIAAVDQITDAKMRAGLLDIIGSVKSIAKSGNSVEINRSGPPVTVSAAAGEVTVAPVVRFKLGGDIGGPGIAPALTNIEGVDLKVAMLKRFGLNAKLKVPLHGLSLDLDKTGKSVVKVHTD